MKKAIYLDYNATTPVDPRVLESMLPYFTEKFGNAASRSHAFGWKAEEAVRIARTQVAQLIGCLEQELVFTSGATEAINLAIKGLWENYKSKGNHIITLATEHKAVLDTCKNLEKKGAKISYLKVKKDGLVDLEELKKELRKETILVCIMYVNNETGVIQPIREIAKLTHTNNSIFMCDATQAVGKLPMNVQNDQIDLLCMSAHKFYGPKGIGALYVRRKDPRVSLFPQMDGGGHERGLRSGTLNVPGIVGLGKACAIAEKEMKANEKKISGLRDKLEKDLLKLKNISVNGSTKDRLYNTSNLCFQGIRSETIIKHLPHIALAMGSACTSAIPEPSHVLSAMGLSPEDSYSSIRFSLGRYTTQKEITELTKSLKEILEKQGRHLYH